MIYLANAFSINMLQDSSDVSFRIIQISEVKSYLKPDKYKCVIGHTDTARVVGNILNTELKANRESIVLTPNDTIIVAQYTGPRLIEGATTLPKGAKITFWKVEII